VRWSREIYSTAHFIFEYLFAIYMHRDYNLLKATMPIEKGILVGNLSDAVKNLPDNFQVGNANHLKALEELAASLREVLGGQIHILVSPVSPIDAMVSDMGPKVIKIFRDPGFISITDSSDQKLAKDISQGFAAKYPRLNSVERICGTGRVSKKLEQSIFHFEGTCLAVKKRKKSEDDKLKALLEFQTKLAEKMQMVVIFIL
jgi:hypothetical protein